MMNRKPWSRVGSIYKITNKINDKAYIGQTVWGTAEQRWVRHKRDARLGSKLALHRAIRKYGVDAFDVSVLRYVTEPLLNAAEAYFIAEHQTFGRKGYNLTRGGDGNKGQRHSKATRLALSAKASNQWATDRETILSAIRAADHARTDETKAKLSVTSAAAWKRMSKARRKEIVASRAHDVTDATRALQSRRIREEWVKKPQAEKDARAARIAVSIVKHYDLIGRVEKPPYKLTPQVRANMSAAAYKRWRGVATA